LEDVASFAKYLGGSSGNVAFGFPFANLLPGEGRMSDGLP
jgi:hypothetical protein